MIEKLYNIRRSFEYSKQLDELGYANLSGHFLGLAYKELFEVFDEMGEFLL